MKIKCLVDKIPVAGPVGPPQVSIVIIQERVTLQKMGLLEISAQHIILRKQYFNITAAILWNYQ